MFTFEIWELAVPYLDKDSITQKYGDVHIYFLAKSDRCVFSAKKYENRLQDWE